jgi:hypothetical protein
MIIDQSGSSHAGVSIARTNEAVVLNAASHAVEAVLAQSFDPDHTDPAQHGSHAIRPIGLMGRDAQSARSDLARDKYGIYLKVESITAQILGDSLDDIGCAWPEEANGPVDLHPDTSPTLPCDGFKFINLVHVHVCRKARSRFWQHIKN